MVDTTFYTSFRIRKQNAICAKYYIPLIIHHDFKAFRLEYANKCNVSIRQCFANVQYISNVKKMALRLFIEIISATRMSIY